ncbi:Protein SRG1 [Camellia lanceoleosa]|uniref:Protein SRG1 n=1 Tax=Camellia lanceoleosa TaxID=1840588 RepID=A0ACC0GEW1_9ERIC|nr:Protein SRG1 [Camellia lanceoleosa]
MEAKLARLGSSLLVPSVQELAKESLTTVPLRYVRHDHQNCPISSYGACCPDDVPIIDMDKLISGDHMDSELKKLDYASREWGFFQLINHGVSSSLVEKVKMETQEFFNLPMEEKKKFWQDPGDVEGFGQAFVVSEEQKLDWADLFFLTTLPTHLRKPHLFPMLPLPFRHTLEVYAAELKHLAMKILDYMAKALKMKAEDMDLFEEGMQAMRMNYYPPCPQPELVIGLTPHSDAVGLTILLQLNEMEGLQIKKDGMWIPVKPLSDAFVVNIGDILEIVTNGTYRSIEHRAVVNSSKERLSIATFYNPRLDGEMGPAPSLITPQTPARFKRIRVQDYFTGLFAQELHGKSYLDVVRIENVESQNNT